MDTILSAARKGEIADFRWLETVDEGLEAMIEAIESARSSIRLEAYIFRASPIGERFRSALIQAVKRGVHAQVLVDSLGSISLPDSFWEPFVQAGGQFRWFNPLEFKRLGFRNHRKLLVVDETLGFIGGFNIAPEYQGNGVTQGWHDLGLKVPESLARELSAAFDDLYAMADYKHRRLDRYRRSPIAKISSTRDGQLITTAPGRGPYFLRTALANDIKQSRSIDIISGYFLPPRQLRRAMNRAARAGRRVRLILAGKSDVRVSHLAGRHLYKSMLHHGIEIYEYQPQILHTKMFRFDDVVYAGSANLDKRSLLMNYELLVRVKNEELARQGREFFERTLEHCQKIEWETWKKRLGLWNRWQQQWAFFLLARVDAYLTRLQLSVLSRDLSNRIECGNTEFLKVPASEKSKRG